MSNWELSNLGEQTFSKAFESLIDHVMVAKAKVTKNVSKKQTVAGQARKIQQSALLRNSSSKSSLERKKKKTVNRLSVNHVN